MSLHCKAESSCSHHKMKFICHLCVSTMCVVCKPTTKAMIANYLYCTIFHADTPLFRISRLTPCNKSVLRSSVLPVCSPLICRPFSFVSAGNVLQVYIPTSSANRFETSASSLLNFFFWFCASREMSSTQVLITVPGDCTVP